MSLTPKSPPKHGAPLWMVFLGASMVLMFVVNIFFVVLSSRSPHGMSEKNYYQQSLQWDERRVRESNLDALGFDFQLNISGKDLRLISHWNAKSNNPLPTPFNDLKLKLFLKRPEDPNLDMELVMDRMDLTNGLNTILWGKSNVHLKSGKWLCRLVFENSGRPILERSFTQFFGG